MSITSTKAQTHREQFLTIEYTEFMRITCIQVSPTRVHTLRQVSIDMCVELLGPLGRNLTLGHDKEVSSGRNLILGYNRKVNSGRNLILG